MATPITTITAQFLHQRNEPLDRSAQVDTLDDLNNFDKCVPYVGKLVHVKNEGKIYICYEVSEDTGLGQWRPMFNDQGTEWYIFSSADEESHYDGGELFKISATRDGAGGTPRIVVTYPALNS